jgi:hypothetical protein
VIRQQERDVNRDVVGRSSVHDLADAIVRDKEVGGTQAHHRLAARHH